jgi:hypothetical protein
MLECSMLECSLPEVPEVPEVMDPKTWAFARNPITY